MFPFCPVSWSCKNDSFKVDWACAINDDVTTRPMFLVYSRKVLYTLIGSPVNMQIIDDLYSSKRDSFILTKISLDLGICRMLVF